ncbi:MAG: hypothetical protein HY815_13155 [Candidatus Riflebacteria bacterium]|nr:hypothetical protein [Candidatus Riflebacteria bacterium]
MLAVPDEQLSKAISRWHFQLRRDADGMWISSVTEAPTTVDGRPLTKGEQMPVRGGTCINLSGVITVELLGVRSPEETMAPGDTAILAARAQLRREAMEAQRKKGMAGRQVQAPSGAGPGAGGASPAPHPDSRPDALRPVRDAAEGPSEGAPSARPRSQIGVQTLQIKVGDLLGMAAGSRQPSPGPELLLEAELRPIGVDAKPWHIRANVDGGLVQVVPGELRLWDDEVEWPLRSLTSAQVEHLSRALDHAGFLALGPRDDSLEETLTQLRTLTVHSSGTKHVVTLGAEILNPVGDRASRFLEIWGVALLFYRLAIDEQDSELFEASGWPRESRRLWPEADLEERLRSASRQFEVPLADRRLLSLYRADA